MKAIKRTRMKRKPQITGDCEDGVSKEENSNFHKPILKRQKMSKTDVQASTNCQLHEFSPEDAFKFTSLLLKWYSKSKRDLPWRNLRPNLSPSDRAYAVLVSEVMLQQTQVVTVKQYYKKWMAKWPTFQDLSKASLEEVNKVWAGLGYYGRAKRLWEAAKKVAVELGGEVPLNSSDLQNKLPGVGRYTAGAVASIAFGEKAGAVDGNAIRVLSRVRCLGADSTSKIVMDHVWKLSEQLVPVEEPGNFNQAMMDLGATICTPRKPACDSCPITSVCLAYHQTHKPKLKELQLKKSKIPPETDIEEVPCGLCYTGLWDPSLGVMNFPRKPKKAPPRSETSLVCVVYHTQQNGTYDLLLAQRPESGLLAGLWEFPSLALSTERCEDATLELRAVEEDLLQAEWGIKRNNLLNSPRFLAVVTHIFSHIRQKYVVYAVELKDSEGIANELNLESKWLSSCEITAAAISTAMKKVYEAFCDGRSKETCLPSTKKRPRLSKVVSDNNSKKMTDYFKQVGS